jgi:hypothetical protein
LRRGKTSGESGETGSWGAESTQELQDSMEEPRNHHQGVLEPLHDLFLSLGKNGDEWGMRYPWVGLNPTKSDSPVFQTGLSGFARISKTHPLKLMPFKKDLRSLIDLRPLKGEVENWFENHFRVIAHKE